MLVGPGWVVATITATVYRGLQDSYGRTSQSNVLTNGDIPAGLLVCHFLPQSFLLQSCSFADRNQKQNLADSYLKGCKNCKGVRGELGLNHMLVDIAELSAALQGIPIDRIAKATGFSWPAVARVIRNRQKSQYRIYVKLTQFMEQRREVDEK